jgi:hypothetical protein
MLQKFLRSRSKNATNVVKSVNDAQKRSKLNLHVLKDYRRLKKKIQLPRYKGRVIKLVFGLTNKYCHQDKDSIR